MESQKKYQNKEGEFYKITQVLPKGRCQITFDDGTIIYSSKYRAVVEGIGVPNPMRRNSFGVGYRGIGKYKGKIKARYYWRGVLTRCFCPKWKSTHKTYDDCSISEDWENYQNFCEWVTKQKFYGSLDYNIDKDLIIKGNKLYSEDTCLLVPSQVNKLIIKPKQFNNNLPVGVSTRGDLANKFMSRHSRIITGEKVAYLGLYDTPEEAFYHYKVSKESYIKQVALLYRDKVDNKTFEALMNYEINIDD